MSFRVGLGCFFFNRLAKDMSYVVFPSCKAIHGSLHAFVYVIAVYSLIFERSMIVFVKYGFMFNAFVQQRELRHELISFFFFPFLLIIFGRFYLKQYLYKVLMSSD